MPDENVEAVESKQTGEPDVEKLVERLDSLEADRENYKKNEAGLQRTITDLKTKLEEKERESETAEERLERKLREFEQKEQEYEKKQNTYEMTLTKRDVMDELGIPSKFAGRIYGNTADEIRKDAEEFARIYAEDLKSGVEKTVNERLAGASAPPKAGDPPKPRKALETREDGANATEEELRKYFADVFK